MIIKIDVDGVIRDINTRMVDLYNVQFKQNLTINDVKFYDVDKSFPLIRINEGISAVDYFFSRYKHEIFSCSPSYKGAYEAIKKLHDKGHHIVIVTWQMTNEAKKYTLDYLRKYDYDDIFFTKDKHLVYGDFMIDDNPDFLSNPKERTKNLICLSRPYNENFKKNGVLKFNSLLEAADYICSIKK